MTAVTAPAPSALAEAVAWTVGGDVLTVLVVAGREDAQGWRIRLEEDGYRVLLTPDATTAIDALARRVPPDIAILDAVTASEAAHAVLQHVMEAGPAVTAVLVSRPTAGDPRYSGVDRRLELVVPGRVAPALPTRAKTDR